MSAETRSSNSGIVTDDQGQRHIPESTRADGSTRKAIKIRPGYRPPEDVELYKNRTAEAFRNRVRGGGGVPGAESLTPSSVDSKDSTTAASSAASNKNVKRREARKKAKAAEGGDDKPKDTTESNKENVKAAAAAEEEVEADPEVEREKKARNLKKKLKQARELEQKKEGGGALLPEQIAKVIKINELIRELQALGFDADEEGEKKE